MKQTKYDEIGMRLVRRFGTRDPFVIAQGLGICVYREDFKRLKGMYRVIHRRRCLFLNKHLDESTARIVCAHEIGHDRLHRDAAKDSGLSEIMLYNMASRMEYEANMVAAAILLPDEDVLECIYQYRYDAAQTAHALHSDVNLVALKIDSLRERGYEFHGLEHNSKFLK
ncbi:MAG: ImmA/IrrE family metallo-endopeptidase [Clostridia bacterium]|nr:ImmA/IrrE family metallo-endopeptidase [Clostridia bacterium]